jgi:hypothetical protein
VTNHDHSTDVRAEHVMLDLGADAGAIVLYTGHELHGREVEISPRGDDDRRAHKQVHARIVPGGTAYAAVFDRLVPGEYTLWVDGLARERRVYVAPWRVTELDWSL